MNNHKTTKFKFLNKYFYLVVLFCFLVSLLVGSLALAVDFVGPLPADTSEMAKLQSKRTQLIAQIKQLQAMASLPNVIDTGMSQSIETQISILEGQLSGVESDIANAQKIATKQSLWNRALETLRKNTGIAFKATVGTFLNNLAYDTATYLATGDWGQSPMFETRDFGQVLTDAADNAAGTFLETLGKNGTVPFNLCTPNAAALIRINLGINQSLRPRRPTCTFTQMTKNWDQALRSPTFLRDFQDMFNPWSNDLGIALTLQTGIENESSKAAQLATEKLQLNKGLKDITDQISNNKKSPVQALDAQINTAIDKAAGEKLVYTGTIGDAIGIFINTLAGKLMDQWLKKGLVTNFPEVANKLDNLAYPDSLTNPNASLQREGTAGAKDRLKNIIEPNFASRADYNILDELVTCPDPNKAGPTNCVIDEKFRQAIEKRLTVGQALKEGYLNGNGIFGFNSGGLEPKYNEGYPYRSMLILRKFRIIPVGWELAAEKIKDQPSVVNGTKNLNDLINCQDAWCTGLVDPNWVLQAPQNFCKREGAGPIIISEQIVGQGADASLTISRDENYCADEQSCIKEKADGSCQLYGYCTEERRQWDFNAKSCEPRENTCQTFKSALGQTVSYLENTLNFSECNAANAGCLAYCQDFDYLTGKFNCTNYSGNKLYLNKQAADCDRENEGCHQFIRTNSGGGANLMVNPGFEEDLALGGWTGFGIATDTPYQGANSLKMVAPKTKQITVGAFDYAIAGESYVLSFYAKDCSTGDKFLIEEKSADLNPGSDWLRYAVSFTYPADVITNSVEITIDSSTCLIDNIKLEKGTTATAYSDYGAGSSLIYEKLLPGYLQTACYENMPDGYILKSNAPAECQNYVRQCKKAEAGCELYTDVLNETKIPAKVITQDFCPAECVGYNTFVQSETVFDDQREAYFIPRTAKTCSAEAAGCDQFTNLDEVAKGGEGIEYYSYLRQCLKKSDNLPSCTEFYSWEGSDESGFQLKVESLKFNGSEPAVSESDAALCSETIYNLPPQDPRYRADCRQFYGRDGSVSYHLYSYTIACSDNCHPYRRTEVNIDNNLTSAGACTGSDRHWDSATNQCAFCKNGGVWSAENNYCIYQAIPGQGQTCSASQNGCREYIGNTGNNVRNIFTDDFSDGTTGGWSGASPSNESITLGADNKGHSIRIAGGTAAERPVNGLITKGQSYVLNFVAKSDTPTDLTFSFINAQGEKSDFATVHLTLDWQIFSANLEKLNHEATSSEVMMAAAAGSFYINNITLREIVDRFYLIKDSWRTPLSCDSDNEGNPHPLYMLGCEQYSNRSGKVQNLRQFNQLCSESAVGCELMIDTFNSTNPGRETFTNATTTVIVPADNYDYFVYDQEKFCNSEDKGCQYLGRPYQYDITTLYSQTYLKNNPDKYNNILCSAAAVGCQAYSYDSGEKYFKDPGDQVCEYRQETGSVGIWQWYKRKVKKCDADSSGKIEAGEISVCLTNNDCTTGIKCLLETADTLCPLDNNKTFGTGGVGNRISQPGGVWAGICQAENSGCTEYIDPVSKFNTNLIFNGDFQDLDNNPATADGWNGLSQSLTLESFTLYRLGSQGITASLSNCLNASIRYLNNDNYTYFISPLSPAVDNSKIFYIDTGLSGSSFSNCTVSVSGTAGSAEVKKVVIDYQLSQNVDRKSCNGLVNFDQNCILFNERKQNGPGLSSLDWDADTGKITGVIPDGDKDANVILKVAPDRVCDKWLSCKSYVKDQKGNNVCFDIGLCNAVDENGNCKNLITLNKTNQVLTDPAKISNLTGYSKVGISGGSLGGDYYPFSRMDQLGGKAGLANGNFEFYGENGYPIGWTMQNSAGGTVAWTGEQMRIISSPVTAQNENISYAPEGRGFLKIGSTYKALSENIEVMPGADYVITGYINTKRLTQGQAHIYIGSVINLVLDKDNDWTFKLGKFTAPASGLVQIELSATGNPIGNFYFDDIKITPALVSKDNWYTPQSCRLYSKDDSLSCDYYEDSGNRVKGWYGYCLEYDRPPGDPKACLLWYPIDKVSGDGIEEVSGYSDRTPLYYCQSAMFNIPVERRKKINKGSGKVKGPCGTGCSSYSIVCPPGYSKHSELLSGGSCPTPGESDWFFGIAGGSDPTPGTLSECNVYCIASGVLYADDSNPDYGWYAYTKDIMPGTTIDPNGANINIPPESGINFYDADNDIITEAFGYCKYLTQVVSPAGQNKYWSGRVYENSDYTVGSPLSYPYANYAKPFGSMLPPAPASNPYEWSGASGQPIYITRETGLASAGMPYSVDNSSVIFKDSLGVHSTRIGICSISRRACLASLNQTVVDSQYACQSNEGICELFGSSGFNVISAKEEIKRLFAKNYGSWEWNKVKKKYERDDFPSIVNNRCSLDSSVSCFMGECDGSNCEAKVYNANTCQDGQPCTGSCPSGSSCIEPQPTTNELRCPLVYSLNSGTEKGLYNVFSYFSQTPYAEAAANCIHDYNAGAECSTEGAPCDNGGTCLPVCSQNNDTVIDYNYCSGYPDILCCPGNGSCSTAATTKYFCAGTYNECSQCQGQGHCVANPPTDGSSNVWNPPTAICSGARPARNPSRPDDDYCAVLPKVGDIQINSLPPGNVTVSNNNFVKLTFTSQVDPNQQPLVMYAVDWGDGTKTVVTGVEMRDRPTTANPHSLYHLYSYWDMKAKALSLGINCGVSSCTVTPKIQIKDNWGWCNKGTELNPQINVCNNNQWNSFAGTINVNEK
jgi:hypothetical protein